MRYASSYIPRAETKPPYLAWRKELLGTLDKCLVTAVKGYL